MSAFYTWYRWGMDWGHFQLRAQWNAGWRFFYGIDRHRTVWHLVIGPIELSGHPWPWHGPLSLWLRNPVLAWKARHVPMIRGAI